MSRIRTKRAKNGNGRNLVFLIVDETCCKKDKPTKKMEALSFQYSHEAGKSVWCHCLVTAHVVAHVFLYAWDYRAYYQEAYCQAQHLPFKSKNDLAVECDPGVPAHDDEQVTSSWTTDI